MKKIKILYEDADNDSYVYEYETKTMYTGDALKEAVDFFFADKDKPGYGALIKVIFVEEV